MNSMTLDQLQSSLIYASELIADNEEMLTELDSIIGDGDHGRSMKSGFGALAKLLRENTYEDADRLFVAAGIELLRVMGGASGVIFGTLFLGGHEVMKGKTVITSNDLIAFFELGAKSIMKRGRSKPGDKTMLDALVPAIDAMKSESGDDIAKTLRAGSEGAKAGAKSTEQMFPRSGRSKNFRENALGVADPGSVSVSILFQGLSQYFDGIMCN